jgi:hypothetical protein
MLRSAFPNSGFATTEKVVPGGTALKFKNRTAVTYYLYIAVENEMIWLDYPPF